MILISILLFLFSIFFAPQPTLNLKPQKKESIPTMNFDINDYSLQALGDNNISTFPCYFLMNKQTNHVGQALQDRNGLDAYLITEIDFEPNSGAYYKMTVETGFRGTYSQPFMNTPYHVNNTDVWIIDLFIEYTASTTATEYTINYSQFANDADNVLIIFNIECNAELYKHPNLTGWYNYDYPTVGVIKANNTDYQTGLQDGLEQGEQEGYQTGYEQGKQDGIAIGEQQQANATNGFLAIFGSIATVPITILNGLSDIKILDTPIVSILVTLLMLVILLWIIKRII